VCPVYIIRAEERQNLLIWRKLTEGHVNVYTNLFVARFPEEIPDNPQTPDGGIEENGRQGEFFKIWHEDVEVE